MGAQLPISRSAKSQDQFAKFIGDCESSNSSCPGQSEEFDYQPREQFLQWHDCCEFFDELQEFKECRVQFSWQFLLQFQKLHNAVDFGAPQLCPRYVN